MSFIWFIFGFLVLFVFKEPRKARKRHESIEFSLDKEDDSSNDTDLDEDITENEMLLTEAGESGFKQAR